MLHVHCMEKNCEHAAEHRLIYSTEESHTMMVSKLQQNLYWWVNCFFNKQQGIITVFVLKGSKIFPAVTFKLLPRETLIAAEKYSSVWTVIVTCDCVCTCTDL